MIQPRSKKTNQPNRFKETARELGCDEDEKRFEHALKSVAKSRKKKETPTD